MAALNFSPAQAPASMAEGHQGFVRIQSPLMQITADAVWLVRTQRFLPLPPGADGQVRALIPGRKA